MEVERKRKDEPAAKRRNCLRDRGERREAIVLGGRDGLEGGLDEASVMVGNVEGRRNAIRLS